MNPIAQAENNFDSYPGWVCSDCAYKNGGLFPKGHCATFHAGICGWCSQKKTVTQPRDYGYPLYENIWKAALNPEHEKSKESDR